MVEHRLFFLKKSGEVTLLILNVLFGCIIKKQLMDSFYESLKNLPNQASLPAKRIHFHQFMVDIHKRNHKLQSELHRDGQLGQADVLITIAREIAQECKVLCFDEFQVRGYVQFFQKRIFN
jgi:predicted ATPase